MDITSFAWDEQRNGEMFKLGVNTKSCVTIGGSLRCLTVAPSFPIFDGSRKSEGISGEAF